jgi:hypothetical protein
MLSKVIHTNNYVVERQEGTWDTFDGGGVIEC